MSNSSNWVLEFRRPLFAWEMEEVERLDVLLQEAPIVRELVEDSLRWIAFSSGLFSVASIWRWKVEDRDSTLIISKLVWGNFTPPKVKFFCWLAWRGRIKTSVFMQRIGVLNDNASILYLVIMVWCDKMMDVWWAIPRSMAEVSQWWDGVRMKKRERKIWKVVPLILMWSVWKMRNEVMFNGKHLVADEMLEQIKTRVALRLMPVGCYQFATANAELFWVSDGYM
ncbi:uncharacterized protein LOC114282261 [Camellia sinensis]|uniref:uncharacterized protein LOC114282261 n=1 Tax=Camellia sinensis TaxID=4442 RepID=UPI0010367C06|nr:uncharacterized protein LOC114282261 [Camellia sinensis]